MSQEQQQSYDLTSSSRWSTLHTNTNYSFQVQALADGYQSSALTTEFYFQKINIPEPNLSSTTGYLLQWSPIIWPTISETSQEGSYKVYKDTVDTEATISYDSSTNKYYTDISAFGIGSYTVRAVPNSTVRSGSYNDPVLVQSDLSIAVSFNVYAIKPTFTTSGVSTATAQADGTNATTIDPSSSTNVALNYITLSTYSEYGFLSTAPTIVNNAANVVSWVIKEQFSIEYSLTNCSARLGEDPAPTSIYEGESATTLTITATSGYALPSSVSVTGAVYDWDSTTGELELSNYYGDISIKVTAVQAYSITPTLSPSDHITAGLDNPTTIAENGTATLTFTANSGYKCSSTAPTVTGATVTSWTVSTTSSTDDTGTLVISNPTSNVSFTVVGEEVVAGHTLAVTGGDIDFSVTIDGSSVTLPYTLTNSCTIVVTTNLNVDDYITVFYGGSWYDISSGSSVNISSQDIGISAYEYPRGNITTITINYTA